MKNIFWICLAMSMLTYPLNAQERTGKVTPTGKKLPIQQKTKTVRKSNKTIDFNQMGVYINTQIDDLRNTDKRSLDEDEISLYNMFRINSEQADARFEKAQERMIPYFTKLQEEIIISEVPEKILSLFPLPHKYIGDDPALISRLNLLYNFNNKEVNKEEAEKISIELNAIAQKLINIRQNVATHMLNLNKALFPEAKVGITTFSAALFIAEYNDLYTEMFINKKKYKSYINTEINYKYFIEPFKADTYNYNIENNISDVLIVELNWLTLPIINSILDNLSTPSFQKQLEENLSKYKNYNDDPEKNYLIIRKKVAGA